MEYLDMKRLVGAKASDRLENAVLLALAEARTPDAKAALSRLLACLTAAVAHRADHEAGIAEQCVSDFSAAIRVLRAG